MRHESSRHIRTLFVEYCRVPFPRAGSQEIGQITADLAEEDGYLAGLCSTYLTTGALPERPTQLSPELDERLYSAPAETEEEQRTKASFVAYRAAMHELADALNFVTELESRIANLQRLDGALSTHPRSRTLNEHLEASLLRQVVRRRRTAILPLVDLLGSRRLTTEEREDLREVLADELMDFGLQPDSEPNSYGRQLDDLIGRLGDY